MYLKRTLYSDLADWANNIDRKPLLVRGARQVGKSRLIREFGKTEFKEYIELNLEKSKDRNFFSSVRSAEDFIKDLEFYLNRKINKALIFIDEIQNSLTAIKQLRFLYEEPNDLHVIAAGSLLETFLEDKEYSEPVGRLRYLYLYPFSFLEFASAVSGTSTPVVDLLASSNVHDFKNLSKITHQILTELFSKYAFYGGMPEVIVNLAHLKDPHETFESLISGYRNDLQKYCSRKNLAALEHTFEYFPHYAGLTIKYQGFADSSFSGREISSSLSILEKVLLVKRVWLSSSISLPITPKLKAGPKLIHLDTGLVNYLLGLTPLDYKNKDLSDLYRGQIAEQIVGQTLVHLQRNLVRNLHYWGRTKAGASAEVDFLLSYKSRLIPIEVKSGKTGRLRSLFEFIDRSNSTIGVRVYSGSLSIENQTTLKGKTFILISLPFYLLEKLFLILDDYEELKE